ncbi:MAG: hypothetical protein KBC15_03155 [Candidatus Levybacteria bacterium]|nr:hypothetical protein [Candidatus Levybacteria bacterium]
MEKHNSMESGQVLLVVVLIMVVVLTVGLSVVTRSITSLRTTQEDASSQKAFSAAEAGVEQLINSASSGKSDSSFGADSSYSVSTTTVGSSSAHFLINNYSQVAKDDGADVWLSTYPGYSSPLTHDITIFWGKSPEVCSSNADLNTMAAIEIALISGSDLAAPVMQRYAYDPCSLRAQENGFSTSIQAGQTVNGKVFAHRVTVPVVAGRIMRVIPLYAPTVMAVSTGAGGPNLPAQGSLIQSTGVSGDTQRKIQVFKGFPKVPNEFFPMGIFSP